MSDSLPTEFLTGPLRAQTQATIAIHLMGQFKLVVNNNDCTHLLTYDKVKLLLAVLALAQGRSVARPRLADMLWPDNHDDKGRARVRHALHTLRQAFAAIPDALVSDTTGLSLNVDLIWVDVLSIVDTDDDASLHALKESLDRYSGPFLEGFRLPHSEPLLAWQQSWNARLELDLTQYRSRLIDQYLEHGDTQTALNHAKLWVHQWPEDEACHRLLMRLLLLAGDRDAALSAFHNCCDVLNKRLGVVPSAETRALLGLENQALSTQSLVTDTYPRESSYRAIAVVAIALAWKDNESQAEDSGGHDDESEEALQTLHTWHERLLARIQQHGAWLPHTGATTILAHFGYPSLSERPIKYAIALGKDLASLDTPPNVSIGLAIHADLVLLDHARELRLNGLICQKVVPLAWDAGHGEILLSPAAAARMADWPVESIQRMGRRYLRLNPESNSATVARMHGRLREFDTLIQQWTRHRRGQQPVTVQITGASGLGKSQLSQAMAEYVRNIDGQCIALQSHENHSETPLHAIQPWLWAQLDLPGALDTSNLTAAQYDHAAHDLQARFRLSGEASHALLDAMLNRGDTRGDAYATAIDAALAALQQHTDMTQPVLITWDDIHWNDAASTVLLHRIMASRGSAITMLLCTSRSGILAAPVITMELGPLDATTIAEYVVHQTRKSRLSRDIKANMVADSAGVPLYIKELLHLKALKLPPTTIPRVTDMFSVQLLQLDPDTRNLAYLAALLRTVDVPAAQQILGLDHTTMASGLDALARMGVVQYDGPARIRCNNTISRSVRRLIVRRKKQFLCEKIARQLIRQHQASATDAKTGSWWQRALHDAMQKNSMDESTEFITNVLVTGVYQDDTPESGLADAQPSDPDEVNTLTGDAIATDSGAASPHFAPGLEDTASPPGGAQATLAVLWNQWMIQHNQGNFRTSLHIAQRLRQLAAHQRHDVWHGWALYALALHDLWMGNPVASESQLLRSLTAIHRDSSQDRVHGSFGSHSYALAYAALGWVQALQGRYNAGLQNTHYAIQLASRSTSDASATACTLHLLRIHYLANNMKSLQAESMALLEHLPKPSTNVAGHAIATAHALLPRALRQPTEKTRHELAAALDVVRQHMPIATDSYLCLMARCELAMRNTDASIHLLNEAAAIGQARQSFLRSAEIHCIRGDVWASLDRPELARQEWNKAKTVAQHYTLLAYDEWANERLEALVD